MIKGLKGVASLLLSILLAGLAVSAASSAEIPTINFIENKSWFESPQRISWNSSGNILVTDSAEEKVIILGPSGSRLGTIKDSGVPRGLKVLPDGSILVGYTSSSGGYVSHYTSSGSFIRKLGAAVDQFTMPSAITHDPVTGVIYVADSVRNYVYRFSSTGALLSRFGGYGYGDTQFDYPVGVTFDEVRREVLVADQGNFRIKVFDPAGNFIRMFGTSAPDSSFGLFGNLNLLGKFSKIQGVAVDNQSRAYIVDSYQCAVQVYDSPSGTPLTVFGDYGSGSAELVTPIDVTITPVGQIIVADWNNNRLSFWEVGLPAPPPPPPPNTAPSAPAPSLPADGTVLATLTPTLVSTTSSDAEGHALRYEFQVATNSGFTGATTHTSATTSVTLPSLVDHTTYYWRVRAAETSTATLLTSAWSGSRSFEVHVANRAPSAPAPSSPANGATLATSTPTLTSTTTTDPDGHVIRYEFQVANNSGFTGATLYTSPTTVATLPSMTDGTYYWRVRAAETSTTEMLASAWSASRSFILNTAGNQAPSVPSPSSPADGVTVTTLTPALVSTTSTDPDGDAIRYEFQVANNSGFSGATTYTSATTSTTLPALTDHTTYYWRVRAAETSTATPLTSAWSASRSFEVHVANRAPSGPSPSSPGDGSTLTTLTPTLVSTTSTDPDGHAIRYEFQVANNSGFSGATTYTSATTSTTLPALADHTTYYWRVRAAETSTATPLASGWSESRSFNVKVTNRAPSVPSPVSPASGSEVTGDTATLTSTTSTDPDGDTIRYEFQVANNSGFSGAVTYPSATPSVSVSPLGNGTYYWRVRAAETSTSTPLTSAWSMTWSVMIRATANQAPSAPSPSSPADGSTVTTLTPALTSTTSTDPDGDAIRYEFQVANNSAFTGATTYTSATTSVTTGTLADHTTYYWRVRAAETTTSPALTSAWSSSRSFEVHVANRAPSTPTGLSPASGTTVTESDTLSWSASTDPDVGDIVNYVVELSDQASFSSILETKAGVTSTSVAVNQFSSVTTSGSYYWRVKAVDNRSASSGYTSSNFAYSAPGGATLQVTTNPSGALVYVDGNYGYLGTYKGQTGSTSLNIQLEPGRHVVRIVRSGYFQFYGSYNVVQGQTQTINVSLTSSYGYSVRDSGRLTAGGDDIGDRNPSFSYSAPVVIDWNSDGRKDLIVGASDGRVYYYRNNGSDSSPSLSYQGSVVNTGNGASPFVIDWNNDGKKDLVVGTSSGTILLYTNYGTDSSPSFSGGVPIQGGGSVIDVGTRANPWIVDWNNDTKKDLVMGDGSGYVRVYLNTGTDENPVFAAGSYVMAGSGYARVSGPASPVVFDWDNDGRKDLILGANRGVYWYRNNGSDASPSFSSYSSIPDSSGKMKDESYAAPFLMYWNNNAPYDIIVGNQDGRIRLFMK